MSAILDALKRGLKHPVPRTHDPAPTASVLHTMGYRETSRESAPTQRARIIGYIVMICVLAALLQLLSSVSF